MKAIVCIDLGLGIGKDNKLLKSYKEDMAFFKETISNKTVIVGENTFVSMDNGKPLKNINTIVLSNSLDFKSDGVTICRSIPEVLIAISDLNKDDVYVIGGASIYKAFLPYCSSVIATHLYESYDADTFFPDDILSWSTKHIKSIKSNGKVVGEIIEHVNPNSKQIINKYEISIANQKHDTNIKFKCDAVNIEHAISFVNEHVKEMDLPINGNTIYIAELRS